MAARKPRLLITAIFAASCIAVGIAVYVARPRGPVLYFMPGVLGRERLSGADAARNADMLTTDTLNRANGDVRESSRRFSISGSQSFRNSFSASQPFSVSRGFLTRAIGLRAGEEAEWGRRNGVTAALPFSHNLVKVFPRELYRHHPEYLPLVAGKRLQPATGNYDWNPDLGREDVAKFAGDAAIAYFRQHPDATCFSLGINDSVVFGESEATLALVSGQTSAGNADKLKTEKLTPFQHSSISASQPVNTWFRERPDYSRLVFTFMNRAAAELAQAFPDKYVGCLAYYWAENAPPFRVDPHVIPFLTSDRTQSYDPAFLQQEFDLQERWAQALRVPGNAETLKPEELSRAKGEIGQSHTSKSDLSSGARGPKAEKLTTEMLKAKAASAPPPPQSGPAFPDSISASQRVSVSPEPRPRPRLGLYDYLDDFGFLVPRVPIHALAAQLRHAHDVGFTDYYAESQRNWGLDGPLPWVIAQLLQNPDQDVDALLDVYYRTYFGPAAAPMREFFARCEQQWMRQPGRSFWLKHYRNESQAALFPPEVRRELRSLLEQAAQLAGGSVKQSIGGSALPLHRSTVPPGVSRGAFADRVSFVSDSFRVTEVLCEFQEARDDLTRLTLAGRAEPAALADYLAKRGAFIRTTFQVTERSPLAFYPIEWNDWLRNDPAFAAAAQIAAGTVEPLSSRPEAAPPLPSSTASPIHHSTTPPRGSVELLANPSIEGAPAPGLRIAGLQFGIDLPAPWQSLVEPTRYAFGSVGPAAARSGRQGLRIESGRATEVFQWVPVSGAHRYAARVAVRGHVGCAASVMLTLGWLNAKGERVGAVRAMRLPEGAWPEWVELRQGGEAPSDAVWAGVGIRVRHQGPGDDVDFDDFSLREVAP